MASLNSVLTVRLHLIEVVGDSATTLSQWYDDINKLFKSAEKLVKDFVSTEHPSYKVAKKFLERTDDGIMKVSKTDALILIHTALYEVQNIATELSLKIYPSAVEIHSLAKDLIRSKEIQLRNDEKLLQLGMTKTDQNREIEFVMNNMTTNFNKIDMRFKQIKNYINFIEDQNSALNRLDSALRLKQNIDSTVAFETIAKSSSIEL